MMIWCSILIDFLLETFTYFNELILLFRKINLIDFLFAGERRNIEKKAVNHLSLLSDSCSVYKTIIILFLVLYCCRSRVLIIEKRTEISPILYMHPTFFSFFFNTILIGSFALPHHHLTTLKKSRISRCMYA